MSETLQTLTLLLLDNYSFNAYHVTTKSSAQWRDVVLQMKGWDGKNDVSAQTERSILNQWLSKRTSHIIASSSD